jgi:hypothetical protein
VSLGRLSNVNENDGPFSMPLAVQPQRNLQDVKEFVEGAAVTPDLKWPSKLTGSSLGSQARTW